MPVFALKADLGSWWPGWTVLNLQSLGNDVGVSHITARAWLTILEASFVSQFLCSNPGTPTLSSG